MTDIPERSAEVHAAALLLPWYLNGRLDESERLEVEGHLMDCAVCKEELESLSALRTQTRDMFIRAPGPSAQVRRAVMSRARERAGRPRFVDRIVGAGVRFSRPQWLHAFALLIIVGQFAALTWLISRPGAPPELASRSLSAGAVRLRIVFNPAASEREVQSAIRGLGGHIVDGPTADGAYIVELSGGSPQQIAAKLRILRARPGLVERIDNATP